MPLSSFDKAFAYTIVNEGSYSDHPADKGGATSGYGVTINELARWRKRPASKQDVKNMTEAEAKEIYTAWYWQPLGCHKIEAVNVAICMFDIGIVRGIGVPPKYAQRICNSHGFVLAVDGHVGPKTLAAINSVSPATFIHEFAALTESGFRQIVQNNPSQAVFLKGWVRRAQRLLTLI